MSRLEVRGGTAQAVLSVDPKFVTPGGTDPVPLRRSSAGWRIAALPLRGTRAGTESQLRRCEATGLDQFDAGNVARFWRREGRADFRMYIRRTCRRAAAEGTTDPSELELIAGKVIKEMVRQGHIADPR